MTSLVINCFRSKQAVLQVRFGQDVRKVVQITFAKSDGSLLVSFPYFTHSQGILSVATLTAGRITDTISLRPQGKCTSHLVKYVHHPDGEAHFSQDGKIFTSIRKKSVPLRSVQGHIFTLLIQGLQKFTPAREPRDFAEPTAKRVNLSFDVGAQKPEALKFVGRLYDASFFANMLTGALPEQIGPILSLPAGRGEVAHGFCLGNPHDPAVQMFLHVSCEPIPCLDQDREAAMTFLGAFDPSEHATSVAMDTSYLVLNYPADNFDQLSAQIGSVDYIQAPNKIAPVV